MAGRTGDKVGFITDWGTELQQGKTHLINDVAPIAVRHNYSPDSLSDLTTNYKTALMLKDLLGVELVVERDGQTRIFRDGSIPLEETDIEATRQRLMQMRAESQLKTRKTIAKRKSHTQTRGNA